MKHNQNSKGRLIYVAFLFSSYELMIRSIHLSINTSIYGMFILLIFSYYIFGIFTLREKYEFKEFLISFVLNGILFLILLIFNKKVDLLWIFIFYTLFQNIIRYFLGKVFRKSKRVLILGKENEERKIKKLLISDDEYSYLGYVNEESESLGNIKELKALVKKYQVSEVIYLKEFEEIYLDEICSLKLQGLKVVESDVFIQSVEGKVDVDKIDKRWFLHSRGFDVLHSTVEKRVKRFLDIFMALIVFIIGLPFMIITYILVKLDNPKKFFTNPAFFRQKRIGLGGEEFEIIKFRSMKIHDPKKHSKYASEKDDRITFIGKFIRKTRLDELPQIINVLNGDMSFVGPRPEWNELGREYEKKINMYRLRYAVKPGLTGWAQVMYPYGASIEDAKKKLEYDIYYIKYQSFALDIIILFKTVKVVLFGKGM